MENNKDVIVEDDKKEVIEDELDDDAFLKSLEKTSEELDKEIEEDKRLKNKNAEEARKRREAEAKKKKEEEAKVEEVDKEEEITLEQQKENDKKAIQQQVVELKKKYPDIDLKILTEDKAFQTYLKSNRWGKDSRSVVELYDSYLEVSSTIQNTKKDEVESKYRKASTPSIHAKGNSSNNVGDIYSPEDMMKLAKKIPTMNDKDYNAIKEKYNKSSAYYKNKN